MAFVQATCADCLERVEVEASDAHVLTPTTSRSGLVRFTCPHCASTVRHSVNELMATSLLRHGARLDPQADPGSPSPGSGADPDAPPFELDDLLRLHELLERDDWFDQLLGLTR